MKASVSVQGPGAICPLQTCPDSACVYDGSIQQRRRDIDKDGMYSGKVPWPSFVLYFRKKINCKNFSGNVYSPSPLFLFVCMIRRVKLEAEKLSRSAIGMLF